MRKPGCVWIQEFCFGHAEFEVTVRHSGRGSSGLCVPELRRDQGGE